MPLEAQSTVQASPPTNPSYSNRLTKLKVYSLLPEYPINSTLKISLKSIPYHIPKGANLDINPNVV